MCKSLKKEYLSSRFFFCMWSISIVILLVTLTTTEYPQANAGQPEGVDFSTILGRVIDVGTGQPIENATVSVWENRVSRRRTDVILKGVTKTMDNGSYELVVEGAFSCRVYAYYDDPHTVGYDYLPKYQSFHLEEGGEVTIIFDLAPAASIILEGDILLVDSSRPSEEYGFTVIPDTEFPGIIHSVLTYGTIKTAHNRFVNVTSTQILVPANTSVKIEVEAFTDGSHSFIIDDPTFFYLEQGESVQFTVAQYSVPYNLKVTKAFVQLAETHLTEVEQLGFYVIAERRDLEKTTSLIESAEVKLSGGLYKECYADLREVYTKTAFIDSQVQFMYVDASTSVAVIIVFLAFTATALSYLLFEHWAKQAITTGAIYTLFITIFYYVYAGCRIIPTITILEMAGVSILISSLIAFALPNRFSMFIVFDLAKRNIRRRMIRFTLTLIPITVMVMGFVALTSFSTEYDFTQRTLSSVPIETQSLLLRQPLPEIPPLRADTQMVATFTPLETSAIEWLQKKSEVISVAPKVENWPTRRPLGALSTSEDRLSLFGVLGIPPQVEADITGFDDLLVEGRYLHDDEEDAIMISVKAADGLNINVDDWVVFRVGDASIEVRVVGLLNDHDLKYIEDLDGERMIPEKLIIVVEDGVVVYASIDPCDPTEVVVTTWQTALQLSPLIIMTRIDALIDDTVDRLPFARQIALERDYWVWTTDVGQIMLVGLMSHFETKGLSVFIPWSIVLLNVSIVMVNTIYERRREISILSAVGLNPTHITSIFGAEALFTGVIGGGIGYLLGLSLYGPLALLSISIDVTQKISAGWSLASLGIALTAVLIGSVIALRSSVNLTPSLLRKWTMEQKTEETGDTGDFQIPIRLYEDEVDSLLTYVKRRIQDHVRINYPQQKDWITHQTTQSKVNTADTHRKLIDFKYAFGQNDPLSSFPFQIIAEQKRKDQSYTLKVSSKSTDSASMSKLVTFIRMLIVDWSAREKGKGI